MQTRLLAAALALALAAALVLAVGRSGGEANRTGGGLLIVTTFPNLVDDVRLVACPDDTVESIVPPGVDPHSYQLTPEALRLLQEADIVVSTGHAPFEVKIRDIVPRDKLVEILSMPGLRLLKNPVTGQPNYHLPIYDPGNYEKFITYLAERLAEARPMCRDKYLANAAAVRERLHRLLEKAPRLRGEAVASAPPVQYAVSWLGLNVTWLLSPEHGVPPTPGGIEKARSLLEGGAVAAIMAVDGKPLTAADGKLAELARETGSPVLMVPPPYSPGSIIDKLELVAAEAANMTAGR